MQPVEPINVIEMFPVEANHLLGLLAGLSSEEWARATVCPGWSVKDIVQHLLADDLSILSGGRDGYRSADSDGWDLSNWDQMVDFINHQNETWVAATRRLSPCVLMDLLAFSRPQVHAHFKSLDLYAVGMPVDWAGPGPAPVWLDVAREYTERWLHQQHIRLAVDRPILINREIFQPVLDAFMRALPHAYRAVDASIDTRIEVNIEGEAGGTWTLLREPGGWTLWTNGSPDPEVRIRLDQGSAWQLFTRGLSAEAAHRQVRIEGDQALGQPLLNMVSIIA